MSIDKIYASVGEIFHKILKTHKKEHRVFLKIKEIVVNHPKKWVIRNEDGHCLTLNKKQYPKPDFLLKTKESHNAIIRGKQIISFDFSSNTNVNIQATKIKQAPMMHLIKKSSNHSRN